MTYSSYNCYQILDNFLGCPHPFVVSVRDLKYWGIGQHPKLPWVSTGVGASSQTNIPTPTSVVMTVRYRVVSLPSPYLWGWERKVRTKSDTSSSSGSSVSGTSVCRVSCLVSSFVTLYLNLLVLLLVAVLTGIMINHRLNKKEINLFMVVSF